MFWETVKLALRTLWAQKFRTFLTTLSVTIGAFSIVVMLSLAQSGHQTLTRSVEDIGGMRLVLWVPDDSIQSDARARSIYNRYFTEDDIRSLRQIPHLKSITSQSGYGQGSVYATADNIEQPDIVGAADGLLEGFSWNVISGRLLESADNTQRRRVVVITSELSEVYFGSGEAIGKTLTIFQKPYRVVGVLEKRNMMGVGFGFSWEKSVFIPHRTAEIREGQPEEAKFLIGYTEDPKYNDDVVAMANSMLLNNHRQVEDFQSMDFAEMLAEFYDFFIILDLIVAFIAGVSLFAGGIGVMNIMLVSVTERVREIGIRKAVGATVPAIMTQFLIEAMTLSISGGILGVLAGLGATFIAHQVIVQGLDTWIATYSLAGVALSLISTGLIGLVFGSVPAYRAAKLDIIQCLRN